MKIGISELFTGEDGRDATFLRDTSVLLEDLGFHAIWFPEHVVFFPEYTSEYPYGTLGSNEVGALRGVYEPFVALAAIATATTTVRLGTYVCVIAQREPISLARDVAAVDGLSGGRFDFGIGVGWAESEYQALGVPFARRGARTDDILAALKVLWSDHELSSYDGEFVSFDPLFAYPKPVQRPHPPIVVGGNSAATIRRIVEHGNGWAGYNLEVDEVARFIERLDTALTAAGRSLDEIQLRVGRRAKGKTEADWEDDARYIEACAPLGLHEVVVSPRFEVDGYEANARRYAEIIGLEGRTSS
ncbi:MAG: TIGR03619 family F420-dependent LLM class oxidoreductase [Ilumatobacteraceae bacterium]|nr:TIGR03619 family F420-dependent LLM class oxidoreductase [Ilumatobacteraceae bacterium]